MQNILDLFQTGQSLFIPGASAEPRPFVQAISDAATTLADLEIVNSFVPGINKIPLAGADNTLTETTVFPRRDFADSGSRLRLMPLSYYGFTNYLEQRELDWAIAHLSLPDADGYCSMGVSAEFLPSVLNSSKRVIGFLNKQMPYVPGAPRIHIDRLDHSLEVDWALATYDPGAADAASTRIANHLGTLIDSDTVLQVGLGKIPNQLIASLDNVEQLKFHSGMLSDGFLRLLERGKLDPSFIHTSCCALGSTEFYQGLAELTDAQNLALKGVNQTHAPTNLNQLENLVAVNSALEIDLSGQANLEMIGTKQISSAGGAPDFARAARLMAGGKSIIALPATSREGKTSRIVPTLGPVTSLSRYDIDFVVTEHGIAQLSDKSVDERAAALINIAAPEFKDDLHAHWASTS